MRLRRGARAIIRGAVDPAVTDEHAVLAAGPCSGFEPRIA
jgi:hypothetical protein